jgi:hypothetical protein
MLASLRKYYHAPLPGLLAFVMVFIWQGLGHTVMVLMEQVFGATWVFQSAFVVGAVGAVCVWVGRNKPELSATLWGFAGGSLIWTGWIEFSFVWVADHLGVQDLGQTEAEYRIMPSSIGVMIATLVFFYFNKDTRCNAFRWLHRRLHMDPGASHSSQGRNISAIVAMEAIYITWFFYIALLLLYDERWAGDHHPATYVAFFVFMVWGLYLLQRLLRFQRVAPAVRYGIPTAIILWNLWEIGGRWGIVSDFWIHPWDYASELGVIGLALGVVIVLSILSPARQPLDPDAVLDPASTSKSG